MVVEHLFPESLLERKHWTAFVLAVIYSTIGIIIARLLFPANSGIVSVVFVSIFLIPYFNTILKEDEERELVARKLSFWKMFKLNTDALKIYFFIFIGIYFTYMIYSFIAPALGFDVGRVFREQVILDGVRGGVDFSSATFLSILANNWWVLLACFLVALVAGDGAVFFIAWNASAWGTIFGYRAVMAGTVDGYTALGSLAIIVLITFPHFILEGGAYLLAAIAGGVISDEMDKMDEVRSFAVFLIVAAILYALLYAMLRTVMGSGFVMTITAIVLALGMLWALRFVFSDADDAAVFHYNYLLFVAAILVFTVGAVVETFVLYNATWLQDVYFAAMIAGG